MDQRGTPMSARNSRRFHGGQSCLLDAPAGGRRTGRISRGNAKRPSSWHSIGGAALVHPRQGSAQDAWQDLSSRDAPSGRAPDRRQPFGKIIVKALADDGYILGRNLTFDARGAMGDVTKLPSLLQELKTRDVDAVMVIGYPAAVAARRREFRPSAPSAWRSRSNRADR